MRRTRWRSSQRAELQPHLEEGVVLQQEPIPITQRRADLPDILVQVVHRALSRQPEDRFPDAKAMQQQLLQLLPP